MNLQELQHKHANTADIYGYGGIPIFAASGIHEGAFDLFIKQNVSHNDPILVLGAGAGAFDKRLLDGGYTNITSVEFVENVHMVPEVKLLVRDLNKDFSDIGKFKAVIALEIIEHLENQFHFVRQISQMLIDKNSFVIVSSPNTENNFSRLKFAISGDLHWFGPKELEGTGHIQPIFEHILLFNLRQSKLDVFEKISANNIWYDVLFRYKNIGIRFLYMCLYAISFISLKRDSGDINIYLIKQK
jgi:hypothetical protein